MTHGGPTDGPAAYRLLVCWVVVYLLCFSLIATKLPNYVLPVVVPSSVLIGRFLQRWRMRAVLLPAWFTPASVASLALIGLGLLIGLSIAGGVGELPAMRGRSFQGLAPWAFLGLIPLAAALLCWWFARQRQPTRFILTVAVTAVTLLAPLAAFCSVFFNRYKAPSALVEQAHALDEATDIRIGGWRIDHLPSLNFYVRRDVEHLQDERDIAGFLGYRLPVYLFMPAEDWQRLQSTLPGAHVVARQYDMYHHADLVVVTNR